MKNEEAFSKLTEAEQDTDELERQANDLAGKVLRSRNDLRQLEDQMKSTEAQKIELDDQCAQLLRVYWFFNLDNYLMMVDLQLVSCKETELLALEKKILQITTNLERLQNELIVTEEKESDRLKTLKDSEKVRDGCWLVGIWLLIGWYMIADWLVYGC